MNLGKFLRAFAPVIAVAMAAGVSGCDGANITINGEEGKKLSELDLTGKAPDEIALLGPDQVEVTSGDKLAITVDGDPEVVEHMRFALKDGSLAILREGKFKLSGDKVAVVHVTMPAPRKINMLGSGKITAAALAPDAEVTVAGSGQIEAGSVSGGKLEVTLPGSGSFRAAGNVGTLDLTILGSGSAQLDAVKVDKAKVTIAGSGGAAFTSDGEVKADILGSGTVTVKGRARCTVSAMGSGKLVCETPAQSADKDDKTEAPQAPEPPKAPEAPAAP
ncbi:head GIN domain-containing protein [Novosphingobium sp.]|uniref:head GIN domain-containing protein n=1 Tax=Novosphingobium sp. TaxID=1874826 RepID=UPI0035AF9113